MKNRSPKFLFILILFFIFPVVSFAQAIVISEIMYAPSGDSTNEWIELNNTSTNSVDVSDWIITEGTASPKTFGLVYQGSSALIAPGGFLVMARKPDLFIQQYDFNGTFLIMSSNGLSNSGEKIKIADSSGGEIFEIIFKPLSDANGTGKSLQFIDNDWSVASPTPGAVNSTTNNNSNSNNFDSGGEVLGASSSSSSPGTSSGGGSSTTNVSTQGEKLEISAGVDRTTSPGSPIWFQATIKKNTTGTSPELNWSFGDGNIGIGSLVSHTYKYSGDYVVVLSAKAGDIFSVSRLKVKVAESDISVLDKGEYLEITNNSNTEINLFNWKIENAGKGFIFQPNTIILPKSSIKLDKNLLTMKGLDNSQEIRLKNSMGQEIFKKEVPVSISIPIVQNKIINKVENAKNEVNPSNSSGQENLKQVATSTENIENIIYEAPKQEGFLAKLTNFFKRVFSY